MRHRRAGMLATIGVVAATLAATGTAAAATPMQQLTQSKSPAAASTPQTGTPSASTAINFEVDLQWSDPSTAAAVAQAVSTPGSASYGDYLTAAQWEARFSPSQATVNQVTSYLTQQGFTVSGVSSDRTAISVSGTAAQVEKAFGTTLAYHQVNGDSLLLANTNLSVPTTIAGEINGISGVSQTQATPDHTTGSPSRRHIGGGGGNWGGGASSVPPGEQGVPQPAGYRSPQPCGNYYGQIFDTQLPSFSGYGPNPPWDVCGYTGPQLRSAYGVSSSNDTGSGVTVAVLDAYMSPTLYSDSARLAATTDPGNPLRPSQFSELNAPYYNQVSDADCGAEGWWGEQTLDVEAVHDIAPGANILAAGAQNCQDPALFDTMRQIVDHHLASVISDSWGDDGGDVLDSASDRAADDQVLEMAAATGVTVMFSAGDDGDEYTTIGEVAADYPASSPWATSVGGTTLEVGANGQRIGEYGWSTGRSLFCNAAWEATGGRTSSQLGQWLPVDLTLPSGGGGGGTSQSYPQPWYQRGVVPASLSEINGPTPMRVEPDISMEADPATGMLEGETQTFPDGVYYDTYRIGGTSVASPLFAGMVARADEAAGHSLGFVNPRLYSLYGNGQGYRQGVFTDILPTHQIMSRADYVDGTDDLQGMYYSTRIVDYEGADEYCADPTDETDCTLGTVTLHTAPGYDNMTGIGSPGANFVPGLAFGR